jgi:penicillin-insensitive murein DD-endopeptidase
MLRDVLPRPTLPLLAVLLGASTPSCIGPGLMTDGSSVSFGTHATGALRHGSRLPFYGEGYLVPPRWKARERNFATDELVELLVRSARRVSQTQGGGLLGVADLSSRGGESTAEHKSHRSGRDVDLIYYATDATGKKALPPAAMIAFDEGGNSVSPDAEGNQGGASKTGKGAKPPAKATPAPARAAAAAPADAEAAPPGMTGTTAEPRRLDLKRNWAFIKLLITDETTPVQWIFVGQPIVKLLLAHAKKIGEPAALIERAAAVMHQPSDAQTHMDHLHLRIYCPLSDRQLGCVDRGPPRFMKKSLKYTDVPPPQRALTLPGAVRLSLTFPALLGS